MTPQFLTGLLFIFAAGWGAGWVARAWRHERERQETRQRLLEWEGAYSRWNVHRSIFGDFDPTNGVYRTGVYAGKNSFEVMARLGRPAPGRPVSCLV